MLFTIHSIDIYRIMEPFEREIIRSNIVRLAKDTEITKNHLKIHMQRRMLSDEDCD